MRQAQPPELLSRAALLFDLLVGVVQRYEPEVAAVLREERSTAGMSAEKLGRTLQAQGIWFQLLAIAEQNRDMRNRREIERERGYEQLRGTFASVFASAAAEGITRRRDPPGALGAARAAGDHRPSDRGQARHRARAAPTHLPATA